MAEDRFGRRPIDTFTKAELNRLRTRYEGHKERKTYIAKAFNIAVDQLRDYAKLNHWKERAAGHSLTRKYDT